MDLGQMLAQLGMQRIGMDQQNLEADHQAAFPGIAGSNNLMRDLMAIFDPQLRAENAINQSAAIGRMGAQRGELRRTHIPLTPDGRLNVPR